jgi:hypothetical protein
MSDSTLANPVDIELIQEVEKLNIDSQVEDAGASADKTV